MNFLRFFLLAMLFTRPLSATEVPFYVGTLTNPAPSEGIYLGTLDTESGKLGPLKVAAKTKNPNFLALSRDRQFLYASISSPHGSAVEAYARRPDGTLLLLNERPAGGDDCCHVSVDATGHSVFVANYGGGNVAGFVTKSNGSLNERTALIPFTGSGPNPSRQKKPYGHAIYPDPENKFVYACDLGSDSVWIFRLDAEHGTLTPTHPPAAKLPPGAGPRHLAFHPNGKWVYVANELDMTVSVFQRNLLTGQLTLIKSVSTLPEGASIEGVSVAEIEFHPSGKWLYVSNRGCDTIAVFAVASDGSLTLIENVPSVVKFPRSFAIDPTGKWMITAGQKDNRIAVLKINPETGKLTPTAQQAEVGVPVCILFVGGSNAFSEVN